MILGISHLFKNIGFFLCASHSAKSSGSKDEYLPSTNLQWSEEQVFENRLCDIRQSNTPKKEWDELWTGSVFQEGYLKEKITEPGD